MTSNEASNNRRLTPVLSIAGSDFCLTTNAVRDDYFDNLTASSLPPAVHVAEALCHTDSVILDVGANIGLCAVPFALIAQQGRVIAVEPGRRAANDLRASLAHNDITNVELIEGAFGAEPGQATLIDPTWNASGAFISHADSTVASVHEASAQVGAESIEVMTLDRAVTDRGLDRVDFIKIDVEGYESAVLTGASATLERFHPMTVIEFNPFTLSVMASENPLHFLVKIQRLFPFVYGIDGQLNVEPIVGESSAYGIVHRCYSSGQICDLICSWEPMPDTVGQRRALFS